MENTKLLKLLKTFSKTEAVKFKEFVSSPFYNKNINVINLCNELMMHYPEFDPADLSEEIIFRNIFKNQKFDYFKIKNILSDLYQLAESFLKVVAWQKKEYNNDIDLLNELHERVLDTVYIQKEKQLNTRLNQAVKDELYYYAKYRHAKINTSHFKFEKTGYQFNQIQNEFDTFLDYSLTGLLRLYSKMLHNKNHGNIKFNMEMFENVKEYIKDKQFEDNPSNRIYKQIITLELSRDTKDYDELKRLKVKFQDNISKEDLYYILLLINSFCVYRLKLGDESYYYDRFLSFREILERGFVPGNNFLFVNFISTFTSACMADEIEWSENFLNRFQKGIKPADEKSNAVNYCKGFLAYRLKNYDKALEYFAKTNFRLFLMKVMVKSYTLRIYYEMDMHEQTVSAIDSFRHYLKNESLITSEQKAAHYKFLKFTLDLTNLKLKGITKKRDADLAILKKEIKNMNSNPLGVKNWLIEKADNFFLQHLNQN